MSPPGPDADPGGSASLYRYFAQLLSWLGVHDPAVVRWSFVAVVAVGLLCALAPLFQFVAFAGGKVRGALAARRDPWRAEQRRRFAGHVQSQLERLDDLDEWSDYRFARLEAEVETEGRGRWRFPHWTPRPRQRLRREKSLSRALQRTGERLVVLQGPPGSGKSVALRNAAQALARKARRARLDTRIPLYINLKDFRPPGGRPDAEAVRRFVLEQLNQANSRDVEAFLDEEFDRGRREGTWLFLFDSFDEIPEILTSVESDETVGRYADALFDFLHGMSTCPGVIASREFKGPRRFGWPTFTVQRLTNRQRRDLVRRAALKPDAEAIVHAGLATATPTVTQLSGNPMLLGLLCEHVRERHAFPASAHAVFEAFVEGRLRRDRERLDRRFGVTPQELRQLAEMLAFQLTGRPDAGLSPTRAEVAALLTVDVAWLDRHLDALEYVKLAKPQDGAEHRFSFVHRRFQEYFATCVALREPGRVSVDALLLDGQWRETAVAMLQTQDAPAVSALLTEAERLLAAGTVDDPAGFAWPPNSLHLLGLLDSGLADRPDEVPATLRSTVDPLFDAAWSTDRRHYQIWAVQAVLLAEPATAARILEAAFRSQSALLRSTAYRTVGRLVSVHPGLRRPMRLALIDQAMRGRLLLEWRTVKAQLARLSDPEPLVQAARLLRWSPPAAVLMLVLAACFASMADPRPAAALYLLAAPLTAAAGIGAAEACSIWLLSQERKRRPIRAETWQVQAGVSAFCRFLGVFPTALLFSGHGPSVWTALASVASMYALIWPLFVVWAIESGADVRARHWLVLPLWIPALVAGRQLRRIGLGELKVWWAAAAVLVLVVACGAAVFAAVVVGKFHLPHSWEVAGRYVGLVGGALLLVVAVVAVALRIADSRADLRSLRALPDGHELDRAAIQSVFRTLRTDTGVQRLIADIRRKRLRCTPDGLQTISEIVAAAELLRLGPEDFVAVWIAGWVLPLRVRSAVIDRTGLSEATLDAVAQLLYENMVPGTTYQEPVLP
ncbi:NACHT domain-containing protein [Dactylosporangium sp. CS-047395]|uniref:NACHT domain-containing protein n=1 Tax=Dactylosporangium sp. CS-047395 TaxID=3239936 RepID=UPI003D8B3A4B